MTAAGRRILQYDHDVAKQFMISLHEYIYFVLMLYIFTSANSILLIFYVFFDQRAPADQGFINIFAFIFYYPFIKNIFMHIIGHHLVKSRADSAAFNYILRYFISIIADIFAHIQKCVRFPVAAIIN